MNRFYHTKGPVHPALSDQEEDEEEKENKYSKSNSNGSTSGAHESNSILQIKRELYERSKQLKSALNANQSVMIPSSLQREYFNF